MSSSTSFIDFSLSPVEVAQQLIGAHFSINGVGGIIVETEAYDRDDPASHSFSRLTPRNQTMFGPPGHIYIYRSYGIHWCLNFVCREAGQGAAVLIRAIQPVNGITRMEERRKMTQARLLCAGPGRLCQALAVSKEFDGMRIDEKPFQLMPKTESALIVSGPRIGISKAKEYPWRFCLAKSLFISRPIRTSA